MTWIHGAVSMDKPVAIVPFAQEFYSVINIQLVKENILFTGQIHRLGVKYLLTYWSLSIRKSNTSKYAKWVKVSMNQFIFLNTAFWRFNTLYDFTPLVVCSSFPEVTSKMIWFPNHSYVEVKRIPYFSAPIQLFCSIIR